MGTWDAGVTTHYQWKDGETVLASDGPLTPGPALAGRTITLAVTGTKPGFTVATATSTAVVAAGALSAGTPTVSGTPLVGRVLTADAGTWGPGSVQLDYAWFADGKPIKGAAGRTLRLGAAQLGAPITVRVTGSMAGYAAQTVASRPTAAVQGRCSRHDQADDPRPGRGRAQAHGQAWSLERRFVGRPPVVPVVRRRQGDPRRVPGDVAADQGSSRQADHRQGHRFGPRLPDGDGDVEGHQEGALIGVRLKPSEDESPVCTGM